MDRPKLTKKHATFDSANSARYHQTPLNEPLMKHHNWHDQQLESIADNPIDATNLPPIPPIPRAAPYHQTSSPNDHSQSIRRPPTPRKLTHCQPDQQYRPHCNPPSTPPQTNTTSRTENFETRSVPMNVDDQSVDDKIFVHHDDDTMDSRLIDRPHNLSKLTLSSSLQLINDSKFINRKNHPKPDSPPSTTTIARNNPSNFDENAPDGPINITIITESVNEQRQTSKPQPRELPKYNSVHDTSPHGTSNHLHNPSISPKLNNCSNSKPAKTANSQLKTVHCVVGNESCDLDSAVSTLLFFHLIQRNADEFNGSESATTLYLPIMNVTRRALETKRDVLWFLKHTLNIDKEYLTCKDDINWEEIKENQIELLFTLVDHNYNAEFLEIGRVVEIIDHHDLLNAEWIQRNHRNIRLTLDPCVGSCTTLVAERLFYHYAEHHVPDDFLLLIYGTLLLDTTNFSERIGRFTRRDIMLFRKISHLFRSRKPEREQLFNLLKEAKSSTIDMGFFGLVSRDCKSFYINGIRVGIASIIGKLSAKESLSLAANCDLEELFRLNKYDAFILMALIEDLSKPDGASRDLVLISTNDKLFEELCARLEHEKALLNLEQTFGLRSVSTDPEDVEVVAHASDKLAGASKQQAPQPKAPELGVSSRFSYKSRSWRQHNVGASRKVLAPIVQEVLFDQKWAKKTQQK